MRVLITGSAGFIGSELVVRLLRRGDQVIGIDNHNDYYDPSLKEARLGRFVSDLNYFHHRIDLANRDAVSDVFKNHKPTHVVNLAAQAGVRYSITNPSLYIDSNIVGFANILECCRMNGIEHLVYASSSSVYGLNKSMPFSTKDNANHPASLYAASKRANELMAHTYSHLFNLPTTGLRFFTVYGPWGRPDMALHKFTTAIVENRPITVFNYGKHRRDFTYIDDVVEAMLRVVDQPARPSEDWNGFNPDPRKSSAPWRIYNVGNNQPVELMEYIRLIEMALGKSAVMKFEPLQPGDVLETYADVDDFISEFDFKPSTEISFGIAQFVGWYKDYYKL